MPKPSVTGPVRTAVQMAPAAVVTEFLDVFVHDFNDRQYAVVLAALTLGFSYLQNLVEQIKGRAFLKETPGR